MTYEEFYETLSDDEKKFADDGIALVERLGNALYYTALAALLKSGTQTAPIGAVLDRHAMQAHDNAMHQWREFARAATAWIGTSKR